MIKKNAIMRYKTLDSLLSNRNRYYSVPDLLKRVNEVLELDGMEPVSRRCIEKDLNALECAPYDAPIERVWYGGKNASGMRMRDSQSSHRSSPERRRICYRKY